MSENFERDWTIMIYMAGDNNLSIDMVYALEQIKLAADQNENINLLAYFDGYSSNVPTLYCDFTGFDSINYCRSDSVKDKLIKSDDDFNENSAAVNNVLNFVDWCVNKVEYEENGKTFRGRKAKNYAMIFSGHSFGFQSEGLFKDEKANYSMNLSRLRWMFKRLTMPQAELEKLAETGQNWDGEALSDEQIKERTTEIIGKPLTLLGFDSCVMSLLEVGCQFQTVAETMVASEGSVPNAGWSYAQILLGKISKDKTASSRDIAASFVENFIRQQNKYALADMSVDMTAWDLSALDDLEESFAVFVQKLLDCFADANSISYKQLKRILIQVHWQCQTYMYQQNVDLGDLCQLLIAEIDSLKTEIQTTLIQPILELEKACHEVIKKIRACVILTGFSGGGYQFSNGISLFFPWSWSSYLVSRSSYEDLWFVRKKDAGRLWNRFLRKYLCEISRRRAKSLSPVKNDGTLVKNPDGSVVYQSYEYLSETNQHVTAGIFAGGKIPEDGTLKIPEDGTLKIPEDGTLKIPEDGTLKIPEDGTLKLVGGSGSILPKFMETRNIESFWNRSGFISNQVQFSLEKDGKDAADEEISITESIIMEIPSENKGQGKRIETVSVSTNSIKGKKEKIEDVKKKKKPKK